MLAIALMGVILFIVAGLAWTARLVHVGNLDARALAEKVATPAPTSALDWPELHLQAVVAQPDEQSLVLLHVGWPAYPERAVTLLVALDRGDQRSLSVLDRWCACQASISPEWRDGGQLELRRRQSLERVHAVLLAENLPHPAAVPGPAGPARPAARRSARSRGLRSPPRGQRPAGSSDLSLATWILR